MVTPARAPGRRVLVATLVAVGAPALVTMLALTTSDPLVPALLYVLAIAAASAAGGLWFGILASVIAVVPLNLFFTSPRGEFALSRTEDAVAIAVFLSTAMTVGALIDRERRARDVARTERVIATRLQETADALSFAMTPEQVLDAVLTKSVEAAEARAALIALVSEDGEALEILAYRGYEADDLRAWQRFPLDDDVPLSYAVRTGKSVFLRSEAERLERFPGLPRGERQTHALVCLPLVVEGRTIGGLAFSFAEDQDFDARQRALEIALARQAAQALERARLYRETERRAAAGRALTYVGDAVILVDEQGVIRYWNRAAELLLRVPEEDALGRRAADVVPGWDVITRHAHAADAASGELARSATVPIGEGGAERWFAAAAVDFGEGYVYALRDVTEERALEQARTDFVATASHELRTPLAAVYGAVRTLRRADIDLGTESTELFLDMIETETERLSTIVSQILLAGQLERHAVSLSETGCDVAELVRGVLASARMRAPDSLELKLDVREPLPLVRCDEDKLRQVLVNLVENGIKYSPDGGEVRVTLAAADGRVSIAVRDRGLGIPPDQRARVFEKFVRLDPTLARGVGGTGLGLYIARELTERMGGKIRVDSVVGEGSTFTVELPQDGDARS